MNCIQICSVLAVGCLVLASANVGHVELQQDAKDCDDGSEIEPARYLEAAAAAPVLMAPQPELKSSAETLMLAAGPAASSYQYLNRMVQTAAPLQYAPAPIAPLQFAPAPLQYKPMPTIRYEQAPAIRYEQAPLIAPIQYKTVAAPLIAPLQYKASPLIAPLPYAPAPIQYKTVAAPLIAPLQYAPAPIQYKTTVTAPIQYAPAPIQYKTVAAPLIAPLQYAPALQYKPAPAIRYEYAAPAAPSFVETKTVTAQTHPAPIAITKTAVSSFGHLPSYQSMTGGAWASNKLIASAKYQYAAPQYYATAAAAEPCE